MNCPRCLSENINWLKDHYFCNACGKPFSFQEGIHQKVNDQQEDSVKPSGLDKYL